MKRRHKKRTNGCKPRCGLCAPHKRWPGQKVSSVETRRQILRARIDEREQCA